MPFLVHTPAGLKEAIAVADGDQAIWCFSSALTKVDFATSGRGNLTRFDWTPSDDGFSEAIARAVATVQEHHPGQSVWVEHVSRA